MFSCCVLLIRSVYSIHSFAGNDQSKTHSILARLFCCQQRKYVNYACSETLLPIFQSWREYRRHQSPSPLSAARYQSAWNEANWSFGAFISDNVLYRLNSSFQFEPHIRQENIEVSLDITQALINSCMTSYSFFFFFFFWLRSVVLLSYARQSEWHSFRWNSYPGLSSRLGNEVTARLCWRATLQVQVALLINS